MDCGGIESGKVGLLDLRTKGTGIESGSAREKKVAEMLELSQFGDPASQVRKMPPESELTTLFVDESKEAGEGEACPGGRNLLGRYDMVCVRASIDFDRDWNFIKDKASRKSFWVLHAAALNVGESKQAPDFGDFSNDQGSFDESKYLGAMSQIFENLVRASTSQSIEHFIYFPFGMGAFLRHLQVLDPAYNDDSRLQQLRRQLASRFVSAFESALAKVTLHICLQFSSDEALRNADAFIRALKRAPESVTSRTTIWPEGDCLHLAHELAASSQHVMLVNGANRQLIGNHWLGGMAKRAIDENLHRRSWVLSAHAYVLNSFGGRGEIDGQAEAEVCPHFALQHRCQESDRHKDGAASRVESTKSGCVRP